MTALLAQTPTSIFTDISKFEESSWVVSSAQKRYCYINGIALTLLHAHNGHYELLYTDNGTKSRPIEELEKSENEPCAWYLDAGGSPVAYEWTDSADILRTDHAALEEVIGGLMKINRELARTSPGVTLGVSTRKVTGQLELEIKNKPGHHVYIDKGFILKLKGNMRHCRILIDILNFHQYMANRKVTKNIGTVLGIDLPMPTTKAQGEAVPVATLDRCTSWNDSNETENGHIAVGDHQVSRSNGNHHLDDAIEKAAFTDEERREKIMSIIVLAIMLLILAVFAFFGIRYLIDLNRALDKGLEKESPTCLLCLNAIVTTEKGLMSLACAMCIREFGGI